MQFEPTPFMSSSVLKSPVLAPLKILAHINVGLGNSLSVSGTWGDSNQWGQHAPMLCLSPDLWMLEVYVPDMLEFKLKLNDTIWEVGANHQAHPFETVHLHPVFPTQ